MAKSVGADGACERASMATATVASPPERGECLSAPIPGGRMAGVAARGPPWHDAHDQVGAGPFQGRIRPTTPEPERPMNGDPATVGPSTADATCDPARARPMPARSPAPSSILIVSAHWQTAPMAISATRTVPLVDDFYGFPQRYYDRTYAAPGAP